MNAYKLVNNQSAKAGDHIVGRGEEQRVYKAGDVVESEEDLISQFPGKFEHAPAGSKDTHADRKPAKTPFAGTLPSKRTPRPLGPEETGRTRAEVQEVAEAIETGQHSVEQRADPVPTPEPNRRRTEFGPKKAAPIAQTARRGDVVLPDEYDDYEERPTVKGKKATTDAEDAQDAREGYTGHEETPVKAAKKGFSVKKKAGNGAPKKKVSTFKKKATTEDA